MAKVNAAITNRDAPVEVSIRTSKSGPDVFTHRKFKNMNEFEAWYSPKHVYFLGASSTPALTTMTFDELKPAPVNRPKTVRDRAAPTASAAVSVNGEPYGSVLKAFEALKLPIPKHQKFRAELKAAGVLTFEHGKKRYEFKTGSAL